MKLNPKPGFARQCWLELGAVLTAIRAGQGPIVTRSVEPSLLTFVDIEEFFKLHDEP
jgi:hypothetical protein